MCAPELKGTTEEKGENGSASSTVGGFVLVRFDTFCADEPFDRFGAPCWMAYLLASMSSVWLRLPFCDEYHDDGMGSVTECT